MKVKKLITILIIVLLFSSCTTLQTDSVSETAKAINILKNLTVGQAYSTMLETTLDSLTFYPASNLVVFSEESDIPGIAAMLSTWDNYAKNYVKDNLETYMDEVTIYLDRIQVEDQTSFISANNTDTLTSLLKDNYYSDIETFIGENLNENMDLSSYNKLTNQYNAYLETKAYINSLDFIPYKYNILDYLTPMLTSQIFGSLQAAENYCRTTPLPYLDQTFIKVFQLENQLD